MCFLEKGREPGSNHPWINIFFLRSLCRRTSTVSERVSRLFKFILSKIVWLTMFRLKYEMVSKSPGPVNDHGDVVVAGKGTLEGWEADYWAAEGGAEGRWRLRGASTMSLAMCIFFYPFLAISWSLPMPILSSIIPMVVELKEISF